MRFRSCLALTCWLWGCGSAFTAATSGPDASSDAAARVEASVASDASDASTTEASAEATAPSMDAGTTEAGGHWCDTRTEMFCADFDEAQTALAIASNTSQWTTYSQLGGQFGLAMGPDVPSPPNALTVTGGNSADVLLTRVFENISIARPSRARLEFELKITSAGSVGLLSASAFAAIGVGMSKTEGVVALAIGNGPALAAVWSVPADAGAAGGDAGSFATAAAKGAAFPAANTWAGRYAIEVTYSGTAAAPAGCAQIYAGATPLLDACMPLPPLLANPKILSIAIGESAAGLDLTGTVTLAFDNVTFNVF